jgi:hypothetical protein
MRNRLLGIVLFAATVVVLIGILKVLNWVPGVMQEGLPRRYHTIEEVKRSLNLRAVYTPSYYPQGLRWPPALITAQTKPYLMVLQEYAQQDDNSISLIITQTAGNIVVPDLPITMISKTEEVPFELKGRNAFLEVGFCKKSAQCSRVSWDEGDFHIMVIMIAPPSDIVKTADSMISGH